MTVKVVEGNGGLLRAIIPDPGVAGYRQVGWAVQVDDGRYLVRIPGRVAWHVLNRHEAYEVLRGDLTGAP